MKKRLLNIIVWTILALSIVGCGKPSNDSTVQNTEKTADDAVTDTDEATESTESIYIVYTNDIHSYIYNTAKDENGEDRPGLRMSNIAAMVSDMKAEGKNVILVDAGDELQGDIYGAFDEGESVIEMV